MESSAIWYISPCSGGYSPIGGGALGDNLCSVCRQDTQTLCLKYTFVAINIPLNKQILSKITRPYTVSVENISFNRLTQNWDDNTPFLNRYNARNSLQVLTNKLSLFKNMKTLLFAHHTYLDILFETQSSLRINIWYSWVILLTLEYAVHVIFIPLDVHRRGP